MAKFNAQSVKAAGKKAKEDQVKYPKQ